MNVKTSWESSLWMVDEVTQLLSNKNLKETIGKNKLVRSKLLEELNSLFLLDRDLCPVRLTIEVLLTKDFSDPSSIANWAIYRGSGGKSVP